MTCSEWIIRAFTSVGEARQAALGANCAHSGPSTGQHLVDVCLVPNIKYDLVVWSVEHVVEGNGELYHPQAGTEMAASLGDGVDEVGTEFLAKLLQLASVEVFQVDWIVDSVQEGGRGALGFPLSEFVCREFFWFGGRRRGCSVG